MPTDPEEGGTEPRDEQRASPGNSNGGNNGEATPLTETEQVAGRGPLSTFEYQRRRVALPRALSSLRHRDFRLYWLAQVVSLTGTWMQIVGQSWLVLVLTNSPFILGVISALQFLPILIFSVFGGVLADRLPRRRVLLFTQGSAMSLAFALATLTETGVVQVIHVMVLATLLGFVNAVDMPTRQAFVVDLVGGEDLHNAIALNSAAFNSARLVGPAVAGLTIGLVGIAGAFYINGLSFLSVMGALLAIRAGQRRPQRQTAARSVQQDLGEGISYVVATRQIWTVVLLVGVIGAFGMNLSVLVPVLARDRLGLGPEGFGVLSSAAGAGSLAAALLLAYLGRRARPPLLLVAAAGLGLAELALAFAQQYLVAALLLIVVGFTMIFLTTLANTILQTTTPNALRGRVMSVYTTVFVGTTPIGSLIAGWLAQLGGVGLPLFVGGVITAGVAVLSRLWTGGGRAG